MNTVLWIVQILLALTFVGAGLAKATQPREKLASMMGWVYDFSANTVRAIGVVEVLGAIGLILPMLTGILPWLTPLAAAGLVATMIGGIIVHLRRGEANKIAVNIVLLAMAAFILVGRLAIVPV